MISSRCSEPARKVFLWGVALLLSLHCQPSLAKPKPAKEEAGNFDLRRQTFRWINENEAVSAGSASSGSLLGGQEFPAVIPGARRAAEVSLRNTNYATGSLIALVKAASLQVALAHPGTVTMVANMSARPGGAISQSRSHRSGRDVDIYFFYTDKKGKSAEVFSMNPCDGQGKCGNLRFDATRGWTLVRSLLLSKKPVVQWIFVSDGLRKLLLEEAAIRDESQELMDMASKVLHEPSDSNPHNDHFHVRIYCTKADLLQGCRDYGPKWDWAPDWSRDLQLQKQESLTAIEHGNAGERSMALEAIVGAGTAEPEVLEALTAALTGGADPQVTLSAIKRLFPEKAPGVAAKLLGEARREELQQALLDAFAFSVDADLAAACSAFAGKKREHGTKTKKAAAVCLSHSGNTKYFPELLGFLDDDDKGLRRYVAKLLEEYTGHSAKACPADAKGLRKCWKKWWDRNHERTYSEWMKAGLEARGFSPGELTEKAEKKALLKAMRSEWRTSILAQFYAAARTGEALRELLPPKEAVTYWKPRLEKPAIP